MFRGKRDLPLIHAYEADVLRLILGPEHERLRRSVFLSLFVLFFGGGRGASFAFVSEPAPLTSCSHIIHPFSSCLWRLAGLSFAVWLCSPVLARSFIVAFLSLSALIRTHFVSFSDWHNSILTCHLGSSHLIVSLSTSIPFTRPGNRFPSKKWI